MLAALWDCVQVSFELNAAIYAKVIFSHGANVHQRTEKQCFWPLPINWCMPPFVLYKTLALESDQKVCREMIMCVHGVKPVSALTTLEEKKVMPVIHRPLLPPSALITHMRSTSTICWQLAHAHVSTLVHLTLAEIVPLLWLVSIIYAHHPPSFTFLLLGKIGQLKSLIQMSVCLFIDVRTNVCASIDAPVYVCLYKGDSRLNK